MRCNQHSNEATACEDCIAEIREQYETTIERLGIRLLGLEEENHRLRLKLAEYVAAKKEAKA